MKILVLSEMTIFSEIKKICEDKNIDVDKKIVITINPQANSGPPVGINFDVVVFQSKNAVIHSEKWWDDIKKHKPAVYCLGKYTSSLIKENLNMDAIYPKDESSSENLTKIIHLTIPKTENSQKNYIVFCGVGGRNVISQMLIENKQSVYVSKVYSRKENKNITINKKDLDQNGVNYIIVSSRLALKTFIKKTSGFIKSYKTTYVVPSKRVIHNIKDAEEAIIIDNSNSATNYIGRILSNEK
jgi:uroporphyrinogen-III synthase